MGSVPVVLTILFLLGFTYSGNPKKLVRVFENQPNSPVSPQVSGRRLWFAEESAQAYISELINLKSALLMLLSEDPKTLKMATMMLSVSVRDFSERQHFIQNYTGIQKHYLWEISGRDIERNSLDISQTITRVMDNPVLDSRVKDQIRAISLLTKADLLS